MKKILAILLAAMMLLSLAACGDNNTTDPDSDNPGVSQNGGESTNDGGDTNLPESVDIPVDKYPFLESLVLPDNAVVTSVDDEYYTENGIITIIVKPITTSAQVDAYKDKLKNAGYTDAEVAGLVSPDGKYEMSIGSTWVEISGYIDLTIYDKGSSQTGNQGGEDTSVGQWQDTAYSAYTNGVEEPTFTYTIKGVIMDQLTMNAEATVDEVNAWKQSLLNAGFEEYREGEQWGVSNATHNIQMNGFVNGVAYIYIGLQG